MSTWISVSRDRESIVNISLWIKRSRIKAIWFLWITQLFCSRILTIRTLLFLDLHTRFLFDEASVGEITELTDTTRQRKIARHKRINIVYCILIAKHIFAHI